MPHSQASQNAPPELQERIVSAALELPGVSEARSLVSVPGARAFVLDEELAGGPDEAFQAGREFAHLHPPHDGSLHMTLPESLARLVGERGWGEPHPLSGTPLVFGPRDEAELEVVTALLRASYEFARGDR
jgi:phospholipase/carboxylesterase